MNADNVRQYEITVVGSKAEGSDTVTFQQKTKRSDEPVSEQQHI